MADAANGATLDHDPRPIKPMPTNPGGVLDPDQVIGREVEEASLVAKVSTGGAKLLGDRRMGKTSLLRKTAETLRRNGDHVIQVSGETSDPRKFGEWLLVALRTEGVLTGVMPDWVKDLSGTVSLNVGVAELSISSEARGSSTVDIFRMCSDAAKHAGGRRVVFVFDEVTSLAHALETRERGAAEGFFSMLRSVRQQLDNVSIVVAGSIGLHHVLSDMKVVNDIPPVVVGALTDRDARYLARCLVLGAGLVDDSADLADSIAHECAAIPFYIHRVVDSLKGRNLDPSTVRTLVDTMLADPDDRWEMRHYLDRIEDYYGSDASLVRVMLDHYALSDRPLTVDDVRTQVQADDLDVRPERDRLLGLVHRLESDHYLRRSGTGDTFATPLLRRAWRILRRLETS